MQYDVRTPNEYMASLDDDWRREKLESLRALIISHGPDLVEGINYKMLSYGDKKGKYQDQKGLTLPFVVGSNHHS